MCAHGRALVCLVSDPRRRVIKALGSDHSRCPVVALDMLTWILWALCARSSQGQRYLFTIIDRLTRWFEAIPMTGITAADCASALLNGWVSRFRIPDHITSDRGRRLTSSLWNALAMLMGSKLHTTSYRTLDHNQVNTLDTRRISLQGFEICASCLHP